MQKLALSLGTSLGVLLSNPGFVLADRIGLEPPAGFERLKDLKIEAIIGFVVKLLLIVAVIIAFIFLLIGGIKWITAGSNKEAAAEARGTLTAAVIGLAIVFFAWAIITLVGNLLDIDIFRLEIPRIQ